MPVEALDQEDLLMQHQPQCVCSHETHACISPGRCLSAASPQPHPCCFSCRVASHRNSEISRFGLMQFAVSCIRLLCCTEAAALPTCYLFSLIRGLTSRQPRKRRLALRT